MTIGYSLRMCARHVDSTNLGPSNLVFRSKPIPEAEMSNRLIARTVDCENGNRHASDGTHEGTFFRKKI